MAEKMTYKKRIEADYTTDYQFCQVRNPDAFCLLVTSKNKYNIIQSNDEDKVVKVYKSIKLFKVFLDHCQKCGCWKWGLLDVEHYLEGGFPQALTSLLFYREYTSIERCEKITSLVSVSCMKKKKDRSFV
jgi:hypothetical protein